MYRNNKLCRLCLVEVDSLVPIFTTKNVSETSSLQMKIMELANVQVYAGDGLPSSVCLNCSKLLDSYHAFKVQIEKADVILRHQLSTNQVDPLSIETKVEGETTDADVLKAETVLIKEEEIPEDQVENILQPSLSPSATHSPLPSPSASPVPASPVNNDEDDETPDGHDNEVDPLSADITDPPDPPTDSTTVVEQDTMSPPVSVPIPVVSSVGNQVISSVPIISSGINQNTTLAPVSVISTGVNQVASISQLPVISSVTGGVNRTTNLASVPVISSGTNQATNLAPLPIISSVSGSVNQATSLASVPVISGGGVNQPTGLLLVATPLIVSSNSKNQDLNKKSVTTVVGNTNTFVAVPTLSSVTAPTTFVTVPSSTVTSATFNLDKTSIESKDPLDVSNNDPGPSTSNAGINKVGESSSSNEAQPKVMEIPNTSNNASDNGQGASKGYITKTSTPPKSAILVDLLLKKSNDDDDNDDNINNNNSIKKKIINKKKVCEICGIVLKTLSLYKKHKSIHKLKHNDKLTKKTRVCEICGIMLDTYSLYRKHKSGHKSKSCEICNKTFQNFRNLRRHKKLIHFKDLEYYACKICGKLVKNEDYLDEHVKRVHSVKLKIFSCDICDKKFANKSDVRNHKNNVHCDETDRKRCTQCNKTFKNERFLINHIKAVHSNISYNMCEICGQRVKCINTHMTFVHGDPVPCDICSKMFSCKKSMLYHQQHTHSEERNWTCEICGKTFKTKKTLNKHGEVHTDERKYECEICHKTFKFKTVLQTHHRVHSDIEPYKCDKCNETFKWKQTYDKHVKLCSGNN
ncbi:uncharacterized protein LOC142326076 isoform X2 [Lycorma delicatula]|uniref:uncharacterized protein LOC142326076 isoform X2 n=1 Tax=Lycorma delicatula TaxID=130591 RepID=UPI003F517A95